MAWMIQLDGKNLGTVGEINNLTEPEIKRLRLILDGNPHFNKKDITLLSDKCEGINGSTKSVCNKIEQSLTAGEFKFYLFRQISGWFNTTKTGSEPLEEIIKSLFYGKIFERFTEAGNNNKCVNNFRGIFLPWLIQVFQHQDVP
jgi:hypothetical protein